MSMAEQQLQLANSGQNSAYNDEEGALQRYGNVDRSSSYDFSFSPPMSARSDSSNMFGTPGSNGPSVFSRNNSQRLREEEERLQEQEVERRKFTRNLVDANRKGESLERYKAIVSLIEVCKRRLTALLNAPGVTTLDDIAWRYEPAASLMQVWLAQYLQVMPAAAYHFLFQHLAGMCWLGSRRQALMCRVWIVCA